MISGTRPRVVRHGPCVRCAHAWPPGRAVRQGSRGRAGGRFATRQASNRAREKLRREYADLAPEESAVFADY